MNRLIFCSLVFFSSFQFANAQISETAIPFSITTKLKPVKEFVLMPSFDKSQISTDNNDLEKGIKHHYFAKMFDVNLSPDLAGVWDTTTEGRVWRLGVRSKSAYSLYLIFKAFNLKPGVKLFVYNESVTKFKGAFTSRNNNEYNVLSVAPIPGEALIIELDISSSVNDYGSLKLTSVGHDYLNEFGDRNLKSAKVDSALICEVDINCPAGTPWQIEKRAVCKILANGELCTGTLINNAGNSILPYFITAQHCVGNQDIASTTIFYFNYERPNCGADGVLQDQTMSGSSLLATTATKLDFALLKLNQFPPIIYKAYFAGWDRSIIPPSSGVCIHHPLGAVKKISLCNHPLTTGELGGGYGYDKNSHWLVSYWDLGTTDFGSSGSPVFNSAHRVVGTLSGGQGSCIFPYNDYFSKLNRAWSDYPDPSNQLKAWLDPNNTGVSYIDGIDPYGFNDAHGDTFSNIAKTEKLNLNRSNLAWGWLSGHNSLGWSGFAEKFSRTDTLQVPGIFLDVAKDYPANAFATISINIWQGSTFPETEKYTKDIYFQNLQENAVNFVAFDSILNLTGTFFIGYTITYADPLDSFAVYQSPNRGASGYSGMYIFNGAWHNISEVTSPKIYASLAICFPGYKGLQVALKTPEAKNTLLKIYPNPCCDYALVEFPYQSDHVTVECVDMMGRFTTIPYETYDYGIRLNLGSIPSGIYTLIIKAAHDRWISRFIIQK